MPEYEVTVTATVRISATNAPAAKAALEHKVGGLKLLRLLGAHSGSGSPPSGKTPFGWKWKVQVVNEVVSPLRRIAR